MGTKMAIPDWDDILPFEAQLDPPPLDDDALVSAMTVIEKHAKKLMIMESPVYVSYMYFGVLSKVIKVALAKGSAMGADAVAMACLTESIFQTRARAGKWD